MSAKTKFILMCGRGFDLWLQFRSRGFIECAYVVMHVQILLQIWVYKSSVAGACRTYRILKMDIQKFVKNYKFLLITFCWGEGKMGPIATFQMCRFLGCNSCTSLWVLPTCVWCGNCSKKKYIIHLKMFWMYCSLQYIGKSNKMYRFRNWNSSS